MNWLCDLDGGSSSDVSVTESIGAVIMRMITSTSATSMIGVTLMRATVWIGVANRFVSEGFIAGPLR